MRAEHEWEDEHLSRVHLFEGHEGVDIGVSPHGEAVIFLLWKGCSDHGWIPLGK